MKDYFFPYNSTYCFVVGAYFDDAALLQTYFEYVSTYESFDSYKAQTKNHVENHFAHFTAVLHSKWALAIRNEQEIRKIYGSMSGAIEAEVLRSL